MNTIGTEQSREFDVLHRRAKQAWEQALWLSRDAGPRSYDSN
jgi:hypothetical protein